jgi:HEAT repeat protein
VRSLAAFRNRTAVDVLLELVARHDEPESVLRAAGSALGELADGRLVTEWDLRDLTGPAADEFFG